LKLTINRTEFLEAIKLVKNAVNTRDIMPITKCILLSANDDGLKLTATDLEMSVESSRIICEVEEHGAVAIEAKLLSDMAAKLPAETIILSGNENGFEISSGKFHAKIFGQHADKFPLVKMDDINSDFTGINEQDFLKLLKGTIFSVCPTEGMQPALGGVFIETSDSRLIATTADGFRVSRRYIESDFNNDNKILFQGSCANKLLKLLNPKSIAMLRFMTTDYHFIIESIRWTVTMRLIADLYPDYSTYFNVASSTKIETDAAGLLDSLERMKIIATKSSNRVKLEQEANSLILSVGDSIGRARDEVEASVTGEHITIHFNIDYLIGIMKAIEDDTIEIGLSGSTKAAYFRGSNSDYEYLVLPMRA